MSRLALPQYLVASGRRGVPFFNFFSATTTDALSQGNTNKYYSTLLFAGSLAGTTTDALTQGSTNRYYADSLVQSFAHASSTIPKTYTSNTWTGSNLFSASFSLGR